MNSFSELETWTRNKLGPSADKAQLAAVVSAIEHDPKRPEWGEEDEWDDFLYLLPDDLTDLVDE